jgi:hypothetical protein
MHRIRVYAFQPQRLMKFPFASREKKKSSPWFWLRPHNIPSSKKGLLKTKHALVTGVSTSGRPTISPPPHKPSKHIWKGLLPKVKANIYHGTRSLRKEMPIMQRDMKSFIRWTQSRRTLCLHMDDTFSQQIQYDAVILCRQNTAVSSAPKDLHLAFKTRSPLFSYHYCILYV